MRRFILSCLILTIVAAGAVHAQPDSIWTRTYGGERHDECHALVQTPDSGYALAGYAFNTNGGFDLWLVRADKNGDSLWSRTYALDGHYMSAWVGTLVQTTDGGFALAGYIRSFGAGGDDFYLVRTDENGDSLWAHTYGGGGDEYCYSLVQTADSGFALAGFTRSFGAGENDVWLVRTDANGDSLWARIYGGGSYDGCYSLVQTADGGFALGGFTHSFGAGKTDCWLVRTNDSGDSLWSRTFGGGEDEDCNSLIQTADGGFALGGLTTSSGAGGFDYWMVRTNENGDSLWSRTFGGEGTDICNSLVQAPDGGFALAGYANAPYVGSHDFYLVRTDENGDNPWYRTFGGAGDDICTSIINTSDGWFALAGYSLSFGEGYEEFYLVKMGPENSVPGSDFILHPSAFILLGAYPNPFNQSTVVSYQLSVAGEVSLSLYDLAGHLISNQQLGISNPGSHRAVIDGSHLPSGTYPIRLTVGRQTAMGKVCLMK